MTTKGPPNGPGNPDDGNGGDDDDEDEKLFQDGSSTTEQDIVDSRSLQHAKIDPVPHSAAEAVCCC